ncbi:minor capsid protein [Clostridioides sp. ZZV14-5902]|uniref:minor capsid protein n=1 Tax=Clostridioides sp. ZZV14-5902 TaxID=2811486 RepID=UPI001D0F8438|nr:capsid protein [Clostridioides sp. ZZV14-5902]
MSNNNSSEIKINIDNPDKILLKRHLNKNGDAQKLFTSEIARTTDAYIPFNTGMLKNNVIVKADEIVYKSPYARVQYYKSKGFGKQGTSKGGLRGKQWIPRSWADNGKNIIKTIARFVGGEAK